MLNLVGQRFGKLVVLERLNKDSKGRYSFRALCDCTKETVVRIDNLRRSHTKSCGCKMPHVFPRYDRTTHGMTGHPVYNTWLGMKARCDPNSTPENNHAWKYYAGKGIRVCRQWENDFLAFYRYMGERPPGMSIDRIDPDGHYEPGNVRWATRKIQALNRSKK